jgi:hypothetical protein
MNDVCGGAVGGECDIPNISVSGNFGASAKSSPPKPHPMSAISTFLVIAFSLRCSSSSIVDSSTSPPLFCSRFTTAYAGYSDAQSISAGLLGLLKVSTVPHVDVDHTYYVNEWSENGLACARCL